jgi:hypothetical protein
MESFRIFKTRLLVKVDISGVAGISMKNDSLVTAERHSDILAKIASLARMALSRFPGSVPVPTRVSLRIRSSCGGSVGLVLRLQNSDLATWAFPLQGASRYEVPAT